MSSSGTDTAAATAGATLCMVLVQISSSSAPAASSDLAAAARRCPASSQSPARWSATISVKSNECSRHGAEWTPPRRARVPALRIR
jgi:hypothetical protein